LERSPACSVVVVARSCSSALHGGLRSDTVLVCSSSSRAVILLPSAPRPACETIINQVYCFEPHAVQATRRLNTGSAVRCLRTVCCCVCHLFSSAPKHPRVAFKETVMDILSPAS